MASNLIITGGAGFIGSNLVRRAIDRGHRVLTIDSLTYAGNRDSLADVFDHPNHRFAKVDVTDRASLGDLFSDFRPDAVLHLAAESHVDRSIDGPAAFLQTNVIGTYQLLDCSLEYWQRLAGDSAARFQLLHVSTDEVFGSLGNEGQFTEASRYDPRSPYAATKASADHLVRAWHSTYGLPTVVTNCGNNFGPFQHPEKLIPHVILSALAGRPIPVYGDGENVRDWIHVDDHCDALLSVVGKGEAGQTYNIGAAGQRSNLQVVGEICLLMDELSPAKSGQSYRDQIAFVKDRPGHDFRYAINASKIQNQLGWKPSHSFESGLRETVQWYLSHGAWWGPLCVHRSATGRLGLANQQDESGEDR